MYECILEDHKRLEVPSLSLEQCVVTVESNTYTPLKVTRDFFKGDRHKGGKEVMGKTEASKWT